MGWRYQVINQGTKDKPNFGIHEIYFDEDKKSGLSWTENPIDLGNYESVEDLINDLQLMLNDAKKHPALLESELNKIMKIQILSDLHLEFGSTSLSFDNADLIILAGDTHLGIKGIEWCKKYIPNKKIIYLLGNHEYYKGSYPKTLLKIKEAASDSNIIVLENDFIDIEGIRFHGCTLWTDFSIFGDPMKYGIICQSQMNDYKYIKRDPSYSKMRTIDIYRIHNKSIAWLEQSLKDSIALKNIVITHHAPSIKSVPEEYKNISVTAAYASNLEDFILEHQPMYWIHGHIHTPCRYKIGETEVICNPHGYIDEKDNGFIKELIIEV